MVSGYFCDGTSPHLTIKQFADELSDYLKYIRLKDETREFLVMQIQLFTHLSSVMGEIDNFVIDGQDEDVLVERLNNLCKTTRNELKTQYPQLFKK
jgi:hypothetical protein